MIKFDEFGTPRKVDNQNISKIEYNLELKEKVKQWDAFIAATTEVILEISSQDSVDIAIKIATEWYKSCIILGMKYYGVNKVSDQIYNNLQMLYDDVKAANFVGIKRTFLTTFTNVAKYQMPGEPNVV